MRKAASLPLHVSNINLLEPSEPVQACTRFAVILYRMNSHYAKTNVKGSVGTAVVCVSRKAAEWFFDVS
jgi:hypothetical protein